jgi:hypothetical protein
MSMSMNSGPSRKLAEFFKPTVLFLATLVYCMFVLVSLLGCIWFFTARQEGKQNSWLASVGEGFSEGLSEGVAWGQSALDAGLDEGT